MSGSTRSNASRADGVPVALVTFLLRLDELARASDGLVGLVDGATPDAERVGELVERCARLRIEVADAGAVARSSPVPAGHDGPAWLALLEGYKARIRAGSEAAERVETYRKTVDILGGQFVVHAIENLASIAAWPSVARIRGSLRARPAVIVSAGPSLEKNIDVLPRFAGKAVIIAVSHALLALHRAAMAPDVVVVTETQDVRYHFDHVPSDSLGALVLGTSVRPELFACPARSFFTFSANPLIDSWVYDGIEAGASIRSGGSVSNIAFSLAALWGCDPIIVVGQDLSFSGGRYYARTTCDGDARVAMTVDGAGVVVEASEGYRRLEPGGPELMGLREIPGYYGGSVPTSFALHKAWAWFVDEVGAMKGERTLVNCTEGGAFIEGMDHVPLGDAAARYARESFSVATAFDRAVAEIDRPGRRHRMLRRVEAMRAELTRCADRARECRVLVERARHHPERLTELKAAEGQLTHALESMPFVSAMVQPEIRAAMASGKKATGLGDVLNASARIYDAVARTGTILRPAFERAHDALRRLPAA